MAREPEKSGQESDASKSKSEGRAGAGGEPFSSKSTASKTGKIAEAATGSATTLPEFQGERHREMLAFLMKRSEGEADPRTIVREFAAVWLPNHVAQMEVLVPALEEEDVDEAKRMAAIVRKDIVNLLLSDLLEVDVGDEATAKLEALADAFDGFIAAASAELDELMQGADDQATARLGQRMQARYERAKRRFANVDHNSGETSELLAPQALSNGRGRRGRSMTRSSDMSGRGGYGRSMSDERSSGYGGGGRSRSRYEDEYEGRSYGAMGDEEEGERPAGRSFGGGRSRGGWFAESDSGRGRSGSGESGWFGDPEGHSRAARRDREEGYRSQGRHDDEGDYRGRSSHSADEDEGGYRNRSFGSEQNEGYYGGQQSRRGGSRRDDEYEGRAGRGSRGGWSGDPEGHSEAARRGWEHRRG